jgi:hypothetical protein
MSDRLTLVVFKDHLSSRTLTVRLAWLRAFGLALLSVIGLAIIAGSLFFNAYRKTLATGSVADSRRVDELEKELTEMKSSYESLKEQALNRASGGTGLGGAASAFSSLPADAVLEPLPARDSLPFRLESMKASWRGNTLQIRSAIEYSREDGGNQQGHFILIARGPQSVLGYPEGTFSSAGTPALLKPDGGEFFSVSRYREVKADFGPYARRDDVKAIEIYVFDLRKRLIYFDRIALESTPGRPGSTPAPRATPTSAAAWVDTGPLLGPITLTSPTPPSPKPSPSPKPAPAPAPKPKVVVPPVPAETPVSDETGSGEGTQ